MMTTIIQKWVRFVVSLLMLTGLFRSKKPEPQRVERMEFNTSTQKIGLRFTEKLRDGFRRRWLKIRKK
ncbi:MAG: hypothetical protein KAJ52_07775 [Sedimentisphaerales bacterium]|nr:hypothetical protein [Sedimentisphaerales bacterium]